MDKDKILKTSRKENKFQDEMEKTIRIQGESFSLIFVFGVGLILTILKQIQNLPVGDILAMFWACSLGCSLYKAVNLKQRSQAVIALFCFAMIVYNFIRYFSGW